MKERLLYIDVLRGIAILTVVYSHILLFCVGYSETSFMTDLLRKYFLNAFFFLSGFMAYKKSPSLTLYQTGYFHELWKKVKQLLIPTLVSGGLYCVYCAGNPYAFLADGAKGGYWFTIALFIMFVIYLIENLTLKWITNEYTQSIVLFIIAVIVYCWHKTAMSETGWANFLCLGGVSYYFLMFTIGVLCKKHIEVFHKFLEVPLAKTCIFLTVMVGSLVDYVPLLITNVAVVLLVYFLVKNICTSEFDSNLREIDANPYKQWVYKGLQIIGQNTIQIYFLHYFLLFKMPHGVVNFTHSMYEGSIANHCSSIVELSIYGTISVCIALVCIAIRNFLAYIPYVSTIMFGK